MDDRELYQTVLHLDKPWIVKRVEVSSQSEQVDVHVGWPEGQPASCPKCGIQAAVHDHRERRWRHLDTCHYQTILVAQVPRVNCTTHGVLQVRVAWAEDRSRFTAMFERMAIDWLKEASISAVARRVGFSWDQGAGIQTRAVKRGLKRRRRETIRYLGVDEKSFQKRHEFVTILTDLDRRRVLNVADDRTSQSLSKMLKTMTSKQRAQVQAIAMDMWEPYVKAVDEEIPLGRSKIVFDKFHIARHLNEGVDSVRKQEARELSEVGDDRLKGTKYLWLKHPGRFSRTDWIGFKALRQSNLKVARAWAMKETILCLWDFKYLGVAQRYFRQWFGWASRSRLAPMIQKAKLLKTHLQNILTYLSHPITNAVSEGINAKIQWIKYTARGFGNRQNFRNAILFHCGKLDLYPSTHTNA